MRLPTRLHPKASSRRGFSLVELSVVVAILSVVAVFGLEGLATFINRTNGQVTVEKLKAVDEAVAQFYKVYGRLPCPTDITTPPASPSNFGLETCTLTTLASLTTPGGGLLSGGVPYRALNIPMSYTLDGFGSRLNYVVTKNLTMAGTNNGQYGKTYTASAQTANDGIGGIEIRSGIITAACDGTDQCQKGADPTYNLTTNPNPKGAAYVIFSSGADRRGAYSKIGVLLRSCTDATSNDKRVDTQNCVRGTNAIRSKMFVTTIGYNVFYDNRYSAGLNLTNYYDDYIIWRTRARL